MKKIDKSPMSDITESTNMLRNMQSWPYRLIILIIDMFSKSTSEGLRGKPLPGAKEGNMQSWVGHPHHCHVLLEYL